MGNLYAWKIKNAEAQPWNFLASTNPTVINAFINQGDAEQYLKNIGLSERARNMYQLVLLTVLDTGKNMAHSSDGKSCAR